VRFLKIFYGDYCPVLLGYCYVYILICRGQAVISIVAHLSVLFLIFKSWVAFEEAVWSKLREQPGRVFTRAAVDTISATWILLTLKITLVKLILFPLWAFAHQHERELLRMRSGGLQLEGAIYGYTPSCSLPFCVSSDMFSLSRWVMF